MKRENASKSPSAIERNNASTELGVGIVSEVSAGVGTGAGARIPVGVGAGAGVPAAGWVGVSAQPEARARAATSGRRAFFIQPELATNTGNSTSRTALVPGNIFPRSIAGRFKLTQKAVKIAPRAREKRVLRENHERPAQEENGRHRREDEGLPSLRLRRRFLLAEPRTASGGDDHRPELPRGVAGAALRPRGISRGLLQRRHRRRGQVRADVPRRYGRRVRRPPDFPRRLAQLVARVPLQQPLDRAGKGERALSLRARPGVLPRMARPGRHGVYLPLVRRR